MRAHFRRCASGGPASTPAYGLAEGEPLRPIFAGTISLLRQELVRADQVLLDSLSLDWNELIAAPVVIDPQSSIVANLSSGHAQPPVSRPRVRPMPKTRPERGDGKERLDGLAKQAAQRAKPKKGEAPKPIGKQPVQVRKFRELEDLEPSAGEIVNEGAKPSGGMVFAKRRAAKQRVFIDGDRKPEQSGALQVRTVLPPSSDRERMALVAVRRALRLDVKQLNDLRAAKGVGVDAIDELRQCYEMKMSSGAAMPSDVTLTASEAEAARNDEDFFLAIVSGD